MAAAEVEMAQVKAAEWSLVMVRVELLRTRSVVSQVVIVAE